MRRGWGGGVVVLSAVLAAAGSVRPAAAVDLTKTWEIGADLVNTIHNNNSTMDDVLGYRVRGGYHFNKYHEVEVTAQFQDPGSNQQGNNITFHTQKYVLSYIGNLKSKKPDSKIAAFIDLGVGKFLYNNGDQGDKSTVVQAGGGLRYFFSKAWAMRIDGEIWHWHGDQVVVPRHGFFAFDIAVGVSCVFGKGGA